MTMRTRWAQSALLPAVLAGLMLATQAWAEDPIGFVKTVQGTAFVERASGRVDLKPGDPLYQSDVCETAEDASLGMTFRDNMILSAGPSTRVTLATFEFVPTEAKLGVLLKVARGTLQYISGLVAKLAPDAVTIETPSANIAVRGTRFVVRVEEEN